MANGEITPLDWPCPRIHASAIPLHTKGDCPLNNVEYPPCSICGMVDGPERGHAHGVETVWGSVVEPDWKARAESAEAALNALLAAAPCTKCSAIKSAHNNYLEIHPDIERHAYVQPSWLNNIFRLNK
jgi:hypothetical protein